MRSSMQPPLDPDYPARLAQHRPKAAPEVRDAAWAAVAAVLRREADDLQLLLMVRRRDPRDPWSGQVCLPGGRREPWDRDLLAAARRETHEELGLDLGAQAQLAGALSPLRARAAAGPMALVIQPYVFLARENLEPVPGPEAECALWLPLAAAARGELDTQFHWRSADQERALPAWRLGTHTVWGLTHRMIGELLAILGGPAQPTLPAQARPLPGCPGGAS
jgi:8-oxo-dGTP pyrophosphatase MutT (NUDIX family)